METDPTSLISIIIPTYNCGSYLEKCIQSVLAQTYPHFELIVINDGSTDNTAEILNDYTIKDNRIKIFNIENNGVSNARNIGIKESKGEYLCFIDADDWIEKDYLTNFINNNEDFTKTLIIQDIYQNQKIKNHYAKAKYNIKKDIESIMLEHNLMSLGSPFAKLYHAETIKNNNIRFNKFISYGEDQIFFFEYITHIENLQFLDYAGYHYDYNNSSLSTKKHPFISFYTYHINLSKFIDFINAFCTSEKVIKYLYITDWDVIEAGIDQGIISKKDNNQYKNLLLLSKSLNHNHLKFANSNNRKIIFILLKIYLFKILLFYKKMILKIKVFNF